MCGYSAERIRQLARDGHFPRAVRGKYPAPAARAGYRATRQSKCESSASTIRRAVLQVLGPLKLNSGPIGKLAGLVDIDDAIAASARIRKIVRKSSTRSPAMLRYRPEHAEPSARP